MAAREVRTPHDLLQEAKAVRDLVEFVVGIFPRVNMNAFWYALQIQNNLLAETYRSKTCIKHVIHSMILLIIIVTFVLVILVSQKAATCKCSL